MNSPFPGMDPYIEACGLWREFHDRLIGDLEQALASRVPEQYFVRLGARSYLVLDDQTKDESSKRPAVAAARATKAPGKSKTGGGKSSRRGEAAKEPPLEMFAPLDLEEREIYIEIHQVRPERRLVTGIEILSPANTVVEMLGAPGKPGKRELYFRAGAGEFWTCDESGRISFYGPLGQLPKSELCPDFPDQV